MNLAEFGDWGLAQKSVGNPGVNTYVGQCVSLIQQYINKVFDVPYQARGNAKDWATNYPTSCFTKLSNTVSLQRGDVLVYGATSTNAYGHIALIDVNNKFYDQNGLKKLAVAYSTTVRAGYICVLRPKNQEKLGLNVNNSVNNNTQVSNNYQLGKYIVKAESGLNVRSGAGTNNNILKTYPNGQKFDTYEIKENWARTPSGWVCLDYCSLVYKY